MQIRCFTFASFCVLPALKGEDEGAVQVHLDMKCGVGLNSNTGDRLNICREDSR